MTEQPPNVAAVAPPDTHGEDAMQWLEHHGIVAKVPDLRTSDFELCLHNPFMYYLCRRLGLHPALHYSQALARGSWFHSVAETLGEPDANLLISQRLHQRQQEIVEVAKVAGLSADKIALYTAKQADDCGTTRGWWEAASQVPIGVSGRSFPDYINSMVTLGVELPVAFPLEIHGMDSRTTLDRLLYHPKQNALWIVDYKTTSDGCKCRLATCPIEFQTFHSLSIVDHLLQSGKLHEEFPDLPQDVQMGGMSHIAIQKPLIQFGQKDRYYQWHSEGKRKNLGGSVTPLESGWMLRLWALDDPEAIRTEQFTANITEEEVVERLHKETGKAPGRMYMGEPNYSRYAARCLDWMEGRGEYQHLQAEREADPTVNISHTSADILRDEDHLYAYNEAIMLVTAHARRQPFPCNFLKSASALRRYGSLSPYTPFFTEHPRVWPEIIRREHFTIQHRD